MNSTLRKSPAGACFSLTALSLITILILCYGANSASAQQNPQYGTFAGCANMSLGTPTSGPGGGSLNGFLPFTADNPWNTNIANAPVDPNSAAIIGAYSATTPLHANFGNGIGGIPYIVVDSTITKPQPIFLYNMAWYGDYVDTVVAPYPENVPVEALQPACSNTWPESSNGDSHALVLDRATCWLYETWSTNTCGGMSEAQFETIWDMTSADQRRPWGWTSSDTAGLSIFAGLVRYEEANSGVINHALRFTMDGKTHVGGDANGGYFVLPATHGGSKNTTPYLMPFGTRLRLKAGTPPPGDGPINMAIYTALQQYGMILADNGGDFMITGDNDQRWNMGPLGALGSITLGDFEVVQMTPEYPGMDPVTAFTDYPGNPPTISSFTATDSNGNALDNVQPGDSITFNYTISGDSYDYIDNIGPIRLSNGTGSITITPTATQEYTLYSTNANGRASQAIWITMPSVPMTAPVFIPSGGLTSASTVNVAILPSGISETSNCLSNCTNTTNASFQTGTIYYTTDGSTPTTNSSVLLNKLDGTGFVMVTPPMTLNAIVVTTVNGVTQTSAMGSAVYTPGTAAAAPVFSPVPTTYYGPQLVTISDTTPGATIYYTTDGSLPVYPIAGSTQQYTGPFVVQTMPGYTPPGVATSMVPEIVQAIAVAPGYANSANTKATYNFGAAPTPTFSPGASTYSGAQTVSISDSVPGASIYYTITPGSTGTPPSMYSTLYTNPIVVATNEVVEAIAIASGYEQSATGISKYIMAAADKPTFSPETATYYGPQSVTISDTTPGATIYYTTDGTTPTYPITGTTQQYTGSINVSVTETVKAIVVAYGYSNGAGSALYTLKANAPTFSPGTATYFGPQPVTINDTTSDATIYYTTDGTTPTYPITGTTQQYTGPINVSVTETVKAIVVANGYSTSSTGSALYTLKASTPTFSLATGTYSGVQTVTISDSTPGTTIYYTTDGTTPTTASAVYSTSAPITVSATETVAAIAAETGYTTSGVGSAKYTMSTAAAPTFSPGAGPYNVVQTVAISDTTSGATIYYTTDGTIPTYPITGTTQQYTGPINVPVTETVKAIAGGPGYTSSTYATATYTLKVATPTFTPGAGTYTSIQTVTISDATPGATIYYTTNGTTPTTASAVYSTSTPITVSASQTLEAIGVLTGFTNSATTTGAYTIHLPAAATPSFSPVAATYTGAQTVTISDTTTGAIMYYTTDGSTPTYPITGTTQQYTGSITVSTTETLKAIAAAYNYANSAVKSGTYTIN